MEYDNTLGTCSHPGETAEIPHTRRGTCVNWTPLPRKNPNARLDLIRWRAQVITGEQLGEPQTFTAEDMRYVLGFVKT